MIQAAQLLLSLSILVVLHELGHFSAARWFDTRVEKFYLFFNPWFSLFKKQIGETEYGIGWLPLGGYVKISGMIDESMDTEQMKSEPQPWEFRSKPAWQRLIIMVAGVFVNFVLGVFIFSMILFTWGKEYTPNANVKDGIGVSELGTTLGLRDGDHILKVGDSDFDRLSSGALMKELVINQARTISIRRDGVVTDINVPQESVDELIKHENQGLSIIQPRYPYVLAEITNGKPGEKAGLQVGDKMLAINGVPADYTHLFYKEMTQFTGSEQIVLQIERNGTIKNINLTLDEGKIGVRREDASKFIDMGKDEYTFAQSFSAGWDDSVEFLGDQIKAFGQMFTGGLDHKESLGSFITIGKQFGPTWDWKRFWVLTASLSLILAFINLLPIPALDGGYVMLLLYESITGKEVPERVMEVTTMIGFFLLMGLMMYALGLDIWKNFIR